MRKVGIWYENFFDVIMFIIELDEIMETPSILCSCIQEEEINRIVQKFYEEQEFARIEDIIKYEFNSKAYLIAAFTHPSSFANRLTNCYERYLIFEN
jgi:hypothetical protein